MRFIYTLSVKLYALATKWAAPFHEKANKRVHGCRGAFPYLATIPNNTPLFWVHCASLGEFEQGKPLIEALQQNKEGTKVLVTFFSPSGYEIKKNDPTFDYVCYLPTDTPTNAHKFVKMLNIKAAFFVKYEFWFHYINALHHAKTPIYSISAIFRPTQYFFTPYGKWFRGQLEKIDHFFVQDKASQQLLQQYKIEQVTITGDTRFDSVYSQSQAMDPLLEIEIFKANAPLIVAGSTWAPDEKLLAELLSQLPDHFKIIIAPHEIGASHIHQIQTTFQAYAPLLYSENNTTAWAKGRILIIDKIGILKKVYRYADYTYVGGAFETGLHNILEPAVFGKPIFFGPIYHKFNEAVQLVARGGAITVKDSTQLFSHFNTLINNNDEYKKVCQINEQYVEENIGAVAKIMEKLSKLNL